MMKYCMYAVLGIIALLMIMMLILCVITPEKTVYGEYTNPVKYWTSDAYFNSNFRGDMK